MKIQETRNYRMFAHSDANRPLDIKQHARLVASMKAYGFLFCYPIICFRRNGKLVVKDGQHRLNIAEKHGLPVYWVEVDVDFDVATTNSAVGPWKLSDYALKFSANGNKHYQDGLDFSQHNRLPLGQAFALLAGQTSFGNIKAQFQGGEFKVKDRAWADAVAGIYVPLIMLSANVKNKVFIDACMAVCRVPDFDPKRLLHNAERCRDKLVSYSTRDAYLDMLEEVYNFGRAKLVGLKAAATMAMRERDATVAAKKKKEEKQGKDTAA